MTEADMQSKFTKYEREHETDETLSATFELKLCKENNALPFSKFEPQQLPSLLKAKKRCVYKKLSDADRNLKPFDAMRVCKGEAWVVVGWHHAGKGITTYYIDVEVFLNEQQTSKRKSLTEARAKELASKTILL